MAGSIQVSTHSRVARKAWRRNPDINVTPLVDVMLVLLIVFMVTAPMLTVAVPVDLPKANAKSVGQKEEPLIITIDGKGDLYLQETKMADAPSLIERLKAISGTNAEARIFVRGDKNLSYGKLMEIMGLVTSSGFTKVALVAELPPPKRR